MEKNKRKENEEEKKEMIVIPKNKLMLLSVITGILSLIFLFGFAYHFNNKSQTNVDDLFISYADDLELNITDFKTCLESGNKTKIVNDDYVDGLEVGVKGTPSFVINGKSVPIGAAPYEDFKDILDRALENPVAMNVPNGRRLGRVDAPVTMVEFSDYQCPFCHGFWRDTLPLIKKNYIDTGKVLFVYKNFPLSNIHKNAQKAAEAAECAGDQKKYFSYHDKLFENQEDWAQAK